MEHEKRSEKAREVGHRLIQVIESVYGELRPFVVILPPSDGDDGRAEMFTNILDVNELSHQLRHVGKVIKAAKHADRRATLQ